MKRNFHYGETKAQRQSKWMADFSDKVVYLAPQLSGKIDWNTANHLFYTGISANDAATQYVSNRA